MSIAVTIVCDDCGSTFSGGYTASAARVTAPEGSRVAAPGGRDYCPDCAPASRKGVPVDINSPAAVPLTEAEKDHYAIHPELLRWRLSATQDQLDIGTEVDRLLKGRRECPTCGAMSAEPCRNDRGLVMGAPHTQRDGG